jgi:glutathione S-transferase
MITLFGTARSRASRSLLALEEFGLHYKHVPIRPWAGTGDREILSRINPNGHIPVLEDDGLIIWESMAINLYLGDNFGGPLWPGNAEQRALVYQWSLWSQTEIDRRDWQKARRSDNDELIKTVRSETIAALTILDAALAERAYLLGASFTLADLNVASTLSEPHETGVTDWAGVDPLESGLKALADWLARCTSRASWARVRGLA